MKKKNLKSLKLRKVEVANLKPNTILGGISGSPCKRSNDCTEDCPIDDGPGHVYTGNPICVTVVC